MSIGRGIRYLYGKEDVMPATEKVYPDWVQKHRVRGTTVKKKGDTYYLYKRTSKRVPGKKYPQAVDTYIGIITPEGVIRTEKKKVTLSNIQVKEYGYSKVIWELCPEAWKKAVGEEWEDVLKKIIIDKSPESYLGMGYTPKSPEEFHCSVGAQVGMLSRRIFKQHKIELKDLELLKTIYLVRIGKEEAVSQINAEQQALLERIGVKLEI